MSNSEPTLKYNFLKFILLQDSIPVAIGFAIATAFTVLAGSVSSDVIKPFIDLFLPAHKFIFKYHGSQFDFGNLLVQIITFVLFLLIIYYLIISPLEKTRNNFGIGNDTVPCPYCRTVINPEATLCHGCGSVLPANF